MNIALKLPLLSTKFYTFFFKKKKKKKPKKVIFGKIISAQNFVRVNFRSALCCKNTFASVKNSIFPDFLRIRN